jgi:hypothetical protein
MIYLPLVFFAVAAVGGLTMVTLKFNDKAIPMFLALGHGILAATGLVLLIVDVMANMTNMLMNTSLVLFIVIALGGFTLFSFYLRKKPLPNLIIAVHGMGAIISFIVLLVAVFK